mgnify:FL=1
MAFSRATGRRSFTRVSLTIHRYIRPLIAGYGPRYKQVENAVKAKYPGIESEGVPTQNTSGAFEVVVDGELIHSKLNGDGYVDSMEKLEKILAAIGAKM